MRTRWTGEALIGLAACCVVGLVGTEAAVAQYPAFNVFLHSQIDLSTFGANSGNDCWGYVSDSGREYALMGLSNQLAFVEITNPASPVWFASIPHGNNLWGDVKVYHDYAYVVTEAGGMGIQVIDMTEIDDHNVSLVRTLSFPSANHNVVVDTDSGYLYTCGSHGGSDATVIFDLNIDPSNPAQVGTWNGAYEHDAQVVTYTSGPYAGRQIMFGASEGRGLDVIDVTDKTDTFLLSRTPYANVSYCHQVWTEDLQYIYVNDELDGIGRTTVFDISDLSNPVVVGEFGSGLDATDHNNYVHNGFVYAANYHSGLRIFDANIDPANAPEVAWFDTHPEDDSAGFDGAWSCYPFFPSGTVIVSDFNRGLFVLGVDLNALSFSYPAALPDTVPPATPTPITVHVNATGAALDPDTVTLHARIDDGAEAAVPMSPLGGDDFGGSLPAADCFSVIEFYVSAENISGTSFTDPTGAPDDAYTAEVLTGVDVQWEDDLEAEQGWTVGALGDDAATGIWERVDPNGTSAQPGDDHTPDPGTMCFVTGQGSPGGGAGENDIDDGKTTLLSPTIDLSGGDARIGYWRWYSNSAGASPNADVFFIDISNNGLSWTNVETIGPSGPGTGGGWIHHEFLVSDFVVPTALVRMRFVASDEGAGSLVEAAIDDLRVFEPICEEPMPGDWDGDGDVDLDDTAAFVPCLEDSGPGTPSPSEACRMTFDFDADLDVDLADFRMLTLLFTQP